MLLQLEETKAIVGTVRLSSLLQESIVDLQLRVRLTRVIIDQGLQLLKAHLSQEGTIGRQHHQGLLHHHQEVSQVQNQVVHQGLTDLHLQAEVVLGQAVLDQVVRVGHLSHTEAVALRVVEVVRQEARLDHLVLVLRVQDLVRQVRDLRDLLLEEEEDKKKDAVASSSEIN